jgi:hypothetical protein
MTKIRVAIMSALAIAALLAGAGHASQPTHAHVIAGAVPCCGPDD